MFCCSGLIQAVLCPFTQPESSDMKLQFNDIWSSCLSSAMCCICFLSWIVERSSLQRRLSLAQIIRYNQRKSWYEGVKHRAFTQAALVFDWCIWLIIMMLQWFEFQNNECFIRCWESTFSFHTCFVYFYIVLLTSIEPLKLKGEKYHFSHYTIYTNKICPPQI